MSWQSIHPNVKIRIIMGTFERVGNAIIIPFMAIYFAQHFGIGLTGVLMAIAVAGGLLSSFYGGYLADVLGRKIVVVRSEWMRCIILGLMALVNSGWYHGPWVTFVLFVANSLLVGIAIPAVSAMILDGTTPHTKKYVYTLNYWSNNLSLAIGAVLGSVLYAHHLPILFLYAAASAGAVSMVFARYVTESKPASPETIATPGRLIIPTVIHNYRDVFRDRVFLLYVMAGILNLGIELQLSNYISIRLSRQFGHHMISVFHWGVVMVNGVQMYGLIRAGNTVLVVLFAMMVTRALSRFNPRRVLYLGTSLFTIGYMVLGFSNSLGILVLVTFVFTAGEIMYVPIKQTIMADLIPDSKRAAYLAVNSSNSRGGAMVAAGCITLGAVLPPLGMSILYGVMGLTIIGLYATILRRSSRVLLGETLESH